MELDKFLNIFLGELLETQEEIDRVKAVLKANMYANFKEYDDIKIKFQASIEGNDQEFDIKVATDKYDDKEIVLKYFIK